MKRLILLVLSFLCWQGMVLAEGEATPKYSISGDTLYYEGSIVEWCEDPITSITYFTLFIEGQEIKGDLVIPEGVDTIATGAFRNCSELTSVSFPKSLESVEDDAFFNYGSVRKISVYSEFYNLNHLFGVIDTLSFLGTMEEWCEDPITSITYFTLFIEGQEIKGDLVIPEGVDTIATGAFRNCSELTSVSFPKSLESVEDDAFFDYWSIGKISMYSEFHNFNDYFNIVDTLSFLGTMEEWCEDPITSITYFALFIEGQEIKGDLVIPEGVDTIATGAFRNCSELTSVSFPKSLVGVEDEAFFDNGNIRKISTYSEFYNLNHCFGNIDTLSYLGTIEEWCESPILDIPYKTLFVEGKEIKGSLIIPEGVDTIAYGAFDRCSLTSVSLPKSINSVEEYSFPSVDTLYYSGSMEKWCESPVVHLDYSNLFIEDYEVKYDLFIPPVSKIANYAFSRCTLLQNVIFHDNRAFVEEYAFPPIERLQYMGSIEEWCESPIVNLPYADLFIDGNEIKDDLVIPEGVTYISHEAFRSCWLTSVTLPQSIEFVDDDAFDFVDTLFYSGSMKKWCESPISTMYYSVLYVDGQEVSGDLVVPEGVEYISFEAFSNCPYITSVSFPKSLNSLNENAFSNNTNVRKVSCYSSYPIDEKAEFFSNNDTLVFLGSMQEWCASPIVNLPYSVLFIDGKEIKDDLVIPEGVTAIADNAFSKCPQISSVTFPQSMLHIGENAFANCTRIRSITCHSPYPPEVFANSFANYNSYLYMPCDHFDEYDLHVTWGSFKYVECSSSDVTDVEGLEIITVEEDVFYFSSEVKVSVYDMLGRCLYSCDGVGSYQVPSKGVYLVKSGFDTVKVVVD